MRWRSEQADNRGQSSNETETYAIGTESAEYGLVLDLHARKLFADQVHAARLLSTQDAA